LDGEELEVAAEEKMRSREEGIAPRGLGDPLRRAAERLDRVTASRVEQALDAKMQAVKMYLRKVISGYFRKVKCGEATRTLRRALTCCPSH
jgi:hypothetical protein